MATKTIAEINEKIRRGEAVVLTADQAAAMAREQGVKAVAQQVDVVTTGTFGPMCSSGAFLNFGHSDPPIKMSRVYLNDVSAYAGVAAVDAYLGATELSDERPEYGGAHVLEELIRGKAVRLRATAYGTDCYPRRQIESAITLNDINEAFLFNPRNAYQNYGAATNSAPRTMHTYMGTLLPKFGNVNYSTSGCLSPLLNDPYLRTIGIGTRIFLGGTQGYVAWNGTQHNPSRQRNEAGIPIGGAATLSLIGDLKAMSPDFFRAAYFEGYGASLFLGVGIPIPILDEDLARHVSVTDHDIQTTLFDYGIAERNRPALGAYSYGELKSGQIVLNGKKIRTAPLSSQKKALVIARQLKTWIDKGDFLLSEAVAPLPTAANLHALSCEDEVKKP